MALCRSSHQIVIKELVGLTAGAYRSLWTFISKHDLVGKVTWSNAPPDDPALDLFMEPRLLHAVDRPGIMFRVVDVPNALLGRGYSGGAGSVTLRVADGDAERTVPMQWYGEYLWRADVRAERLQDLTLVVEAVDARGNTTRSAPKSARVH